MGLLVCTVNSRYLDVVGTICMYSQLSLSQSCGDYFLQVQITRSANQFARRVIWTCKITPMPEYGTRKQSKRIFDSDRRFEIRTIRDIRVRNIESRLYFFKQSGTTTVRFNRNSHV